MIPSVVIINNETPCDIGSAVDRTTKTEKSISLGS